MARYSANTKLSSEDVFKKAKAFFGGTWGLSESGQEGCCLSFVGGGGHVTVTATPVEKGTDVEMDTQEWDYQVLRFMGELHS